MSHIETFREYESAEIFSQAADHYNRRKNPKVEKIQNRLLGHFVGRIGEIAVFRYLFRQGYHPVAGYHDPYDKMPDITIGDDDKTIEVKTWQAHHYIDLGRAILVSQWDHIKDYDFIVWCSVSLHDTLPYIQPAYVTLHGFSTPAAFHKYAKRVRKGNGKTESYQVAPGEINDINLIGGKYAMPTGRIYIPESSYSIARQ